MGKDWDCQRREPLFRNRAAVLVFGAGDLSVMERDQLGAARKTKAGAISGVSPRPRRKFFEPPCRR
jgi:hypothetical protein